MIVWCEANQVDLALSFQEKAGCDELWSKICSIQGFDPSVEITNQARNRPSKKRPVKSKPSTNHVDAAQSSPKSKQQVLVNEDTMDCTYGDKSASQNPSKSPPRTDTAQSHSQSQSQQSPASNADSATPNSNSSPQKRSDSPSSEGDSTATQSQAARLVIYDYVDEGDAEVETAATTSQKSTCATASDLSVSKGGSDEEGDAEEEEEAAVEEEEDDEDENPEEEDEEGFLIVAGQPVPLNGERTGASALNSINCNTNSSAAGSGTGAGRYTRSVSSALQTELPPCDRSHIAEMAELFQQCLASPVRREKLAAAVEGSHYVHKLIELFRECEQAEAQEQLRHLYEVFKSVFYLNKHALLEQLFADECTLNDVLGALEYDPALAEGTRHNHREFVNNARLKLVVPISNAELLEKIHLTYRLQYIQEQVLPSPTIFEENNLSALASYIFLNKIDIVNAIADDEELLAALFDKLVALTHGASASASSPGPNASIVLPSASAGEPCAKRALLNRSVLDATLNVSAPNTSVASDADLDDSVPVASNPLNLTFSVAPQTAPASESRARNSMKEREELRDLVLFLKELCSFAQTLQPPNKDAFFKVCTLSAY